MSKLKQIARTCLDLSLFALVCFAEFALHRWFEPSRRGFFCDDESLAYPFRAATITATTLVIVVLTVPTLVILAVELFKRLQDSDELALTPVVVGKKYGKKRRRLVACYKQIGCYLFGLAIALVAAEVAKYSTGRLRPHFFAVCQPELHDGSTCDDEKNQNRYIENYNCRGINSTAAMLSDLGQSFPSAHATVFFYAMIYVSIYLQASLTTRASKLLKHLLQFVFVMFAWFVALSRIAEYWHHWSDVLAGAILGSFMAIVVSVFIANLFSKKGQSNSSSSSSGEFKSTLKITKAPTTTLPAYTFGSMPYLPGQYGQPYHNYGYVP